MPFKFIRDIKSYQIYHMNSNYFDLSEKIFKQAWNLISIKKLNIMKNSIEVWQKSARHSGILLEYLNNKDNIFIMINKTSKFMHKGKNNIYVGKWEYENLGKIKVNNIYVCLSPLIIQFKEKTDILKLYSPLSSCYYQDELYGNLELQEKFKYEVNHLITEGKIDFQSSLDLTNYIYILDWIYAEKYYELFKEYGDKMLDPEFEKEIISDLDKFYNNPDQYELDYFKNFKLLEE